MWSAVTSGHGRRSRRRMDELNIVVIMSKIVSKHNKLVKVAMFALGDQGSKTAV